MGKILQKKSTDHAESIGTAEIYRRKIIKEIKRTNNIWMLQQIWTTIENIKR